MKEPETINELEELIHNKDFRPSCDELSKLISKLVVNYKKGAEKPKERIKKR